MWTEEMKNILKSLNSLVSSTPTSIAEAALDKDILNTFLLKIRKIFLIAIMNQCGQNRKENKKKTLWPVRGLISENGVELNAVEQHTKNAPFSPWRSLFRGLNPKKKRFSKISREICTSLKKHFLQKLVLTKFDTTLKLDYALAAIVYKKLWKANLLSENVGT